MRPILLLALVACPAPPPPPTPIVETLPPVLLINEVQSDNQTTIEDPANTACPEFDDWVEILNPTDVSQDLEGVELHDSSSLTFVFPARSLEAGERLIVWTDGQPHQGELHADFRIARTGERVALWKGNHVLDQVDVPPLTPDQSYARRPEGGDAWTEGPPTFDQPNTKRLPDDPCFAPDGFDDHSYPCLRDRDSFFALTGSRADMSVLKFDIFDFQTDTPQLEFVDSDFYALHDQFYLFTVLNGQPFGDLDLYPTYNGSFSTWQELNDWAQTVDISSLFDPQQVRWAGDRLYSPYYYTQINGDHRTLGVGSIVYRPSTASRDELWAFELEFGDNIQEADLQIYFDVLEAAGPPEFANLKWLVRSTEQEATAQALEASGSPLAHRLIRYTDLSEPGEIQVYNPGLTAGRVYMVRAGESGLEDSREDYILVVDEIPDYLPPCRALITAVPQTPLSHISLLARSRGIPNLYVAGITDEPVWDAWKRVLSRVAIEATPDDQLSVELLSIAEYITWRQLVDRTSPQLTPIDWTSLPWTVDLHTGPPMRELRPQVGGKAAGMRQLLREPTVDTPDTPLGITIRGYHNHMEQFPWLDEMLTLDPFDRASKTQLRYLVLEGRAAYDARYPSRLDATARDNFYAAHPPGDPAGDLARGQGLRLTILNTPMQPEALHALTSAIEDQFASLSTDQGLRFRSSSNVEDIEGFNGAGLYTSHTGFRGAQQGQPSVDFAIRQVWASYWNSEAFEEREHARIDHRDGGMGILVHPRFDNDFELANAVLTLRLSPDGSWEMLANAQIGTTSVANPPTTCPPVLPEQSRVTDAGVERISESTELSGEVFSDDQLLTLYAQGKSILEAWLAQENAALTPAQRRSTLTLDLEARLMAPGWPIGTSGSGRLVLKQSRSLSPTAAHLPDEITALPVPLDVLARAQVIERHHCSTDQVDVQIVSITTDPLLLPDFGFSHSPYIGTLDIEALQSISALHWSAGDGISADHLDGLEGTIQGDDIELQWANGALTDNSTGLTLTVNGHSIHARHSVCTTETLWASSDTYLLDILSD